MQSMPQNIITVDQIKREHKDVYDASKNIHLFEQDVRETFQTRYRDNYRSYISKYNLEKMLLQQGRPTNSELTDLARKYYKLFDRYIDVTYDMSKRVGAETTRVAMKLLDDYFDEQESYHLLSSST